ncbi:MAG TPA: hypothetical protein VG944_21775 [Fimbriimonas sp.]|nr:hypothetical protein [Fimbriimonas sp.]
MRKLALAAAAILTPFTVFGQMLPDKSYLTLDEQSVWTLPSHRIELALNLSSAEKQRISHAFSEYGKREQVLLNKGAVNEDAYAKLDHALASKVLDSLPSPRRARLHEIALQLKGVSALEDRSVANELGISAAEATKIKSILDAREKRQADFDEALANKLVAVPHVSPPSAYEKRKQEVVKSMAPQLKRLQRQSRADEWKVLAVLSEAQRQRWTAMLGARI